MNVSVLSPQFIFHIESKKHNIKAKRINSTLKLRKASIT